MVVVLQKKDTLIRGRFRLRENAFPSSRDKTESIMKKVDEINKKWLKIRNPESINQNLSGSEIHDTEND